MVFVDRNGRVSNGELQTGAAPCSVLASLIQGWWQPFHSYLFRRSAYWNVGGSDESLVNAQDYDLLIRIAANGGQFAYCPGPVSDYYRFKQAKSLARGEPKQYFSDYEESTLRLLSKLEAENRLDDQLARSFALKLHYIARNIYSFDRERFHCLIELIETLDPAFKPPGSWKYRLACYLLGMNRAEALIRVAKTQ
jgi:hypothetical protein